LVAFDRQRYIPVMVLPPSATTFRTRLADRMPPPPSLQAWRVRATLVVSAVVAAAGATASPPRADPLDPKAAVPAMRYESSLKPERPAAADKPLGWREANDAVARIGGWRVYAREAQHPELKPEAAPAPR
jgi:hypothetical protein